MLRRSRRNAREGGAGQTRGGARRPALSLAAAAWALVLAPQQLPAQAAEGPASRPRYQFLRQNEDWSVLPALGEADRDALDPIKYVRLSDDGSVWASFGGHARIRIEGWDEFNFGAPPQAKHDDVFGLGRLLLHADLHLGKTFRVFAEGKTALASERQLAGGKRRIDEDTFDLQQLFLDVRLAVGERTTLRLRPGRQMLQYGKQRLVSPLPWGNTLRAWDGAAAQLRRGAWAVDGFWTRFVPVDPRGVSTADSANAFYGLYAARAGARRPALDVYWLGLHNDVATFNGTTGEENRHTFGARVAGDFASGAWDYDVEAALQLGRLGDEDILAQMLGAELGRRFAHAPARPRVWLGLDYGSGDARPHDGKAGTFNQLYPLGHAYLGYIDSVGRQNVVGASLGVSCAPLRRLTLALANHAFRVASRRDALYDAGGRVVRSGGVSDSSHVGLELDLTARWVLEPHVDALLGYSHFFAGELLRQTGPSSDVDFVYLSLQYTF